MGTTAEKLTYLNETKTQLKDMLNLGGASLTTEPFRQYVDTLKNRYLYFINNGTDVVWNNWDKVTGEGTILTLNNTEEAPMKINLKGNTSQESTTGKNKLPYTNDINETINSTKITGVKGTYTIQTTPTATVYQTYVNLVENYTIQSGDYLHIMNDVANANITFNLKCTDDTILSPTLNSLNRIFDLSSYVGKTISSIRFYVSTSYDGAKITLTPMIVNSPTTTEWEQFTFGASPNPEYPQNIHVVSGDNSIVVSNANLFDKEYYSDSSLYSIDGAYKNTLTKIEGNRKLYSKCILKEGKTPINNLYMCICTEKHPNVSGAKSLWLVNGSVVSQSSFNFAGYNNLYFTFYPSTLTPTQIFDTYNIMVSTNDVDYEEYKSTSYPISLGDIELCKIGDYQDYIYKNNDKWYLNKQIGKVVLDGSETWVLNESGTGYVRFTTTESDLISTSVSDVAKYFVISDRFVSSTSNQTVNANADKNRVCAVTNNRLLFKTLDTSLSTAQLWKTWLSTNNVEVRYVLNTPTYTEITDSTLLSQLNALAKSYNSQTNISQENNDLASILNATALREMA